MTVSETMNSRYFWGAGSVLFERVENVTALELIEELLEQSSLDINALNIFKRGGR